MTRTRRLVEELVEVLNTPEPEPLPWTPREKSESQPPTLTPSTQEPLIARLLDMIETQARENREAILALVQGRTPFSPSSGQPLMPTPLAMTPLPAGPGTLPGQQPLSTPTYDDDSIPLAPGIDAVLSREEAEEEDRQRALRTQPDVLAWQLEQRRVALGVDPSVPPGSPT